MSKGYPIAEYTTRILGYTQILRPGVKASFGLALDTQKLNDPNPVGTAHKVCRSSDVLSTNSDHRLSGWSSIRF